VKKFNLYGLMAELNEGTDLNGNTDPHNPPDINLELDAEAQKIVDAANGVEPKKDDEKIELPSDKPEDDEDDKKEGFVDGKYADVDALKKGITELKSDLPQYVIDGMSDEALEQHYTELRKNFSGKPEEKKEVAKEEDVKKVVENADLDWDKVSAEYTESGEVTAATREALNKAGIPDSVIDGYTTGLKSQQDAFTAEIYEVAGGQEQYEAIKAWADDGGIPKSELESLAGLDKNQLINSMYGIKARYEASNPVKNKVTRLTGETQRVTSDSYQNQAQYIADVSDPRYKSGSRYQQTVDDKFANSKSLH
jgi:hypothetical protein